MAQARNDAEVRHLFTNALRQAVEYAVGQILELNAEKIREFVYDVYEPTVYERSSPESSFMGAWTTNVTGTETSCTGTLDYAPDQMGTHDSVVTGEDVRAYLADIIYQGLAPNLWGGDSQPWNKARNAFAELDKVLGDGELAKYIEEGFDRAGIMYNVQNRHFNKTTT